MSWLCLPALAADFSARRCSASDRSPPSRRIATAKKCSSPASVTGSCRSSRSETTFARLMDARFAAWYTSSPRVSPASHIHMLANGAARPTNATSGLTPFGSFARYSPRSRYWRTCPTCCGSRTLGTSSATWPTAGFMSGGTCYRRAASEPRTCADGSGYWRIAVVLTRRGRTRRYALSGIPTLCRMDASFVHTKRTTLLRRIYRWARRERGLHCAHLAMLPTVLASDATGGRKSFIRTVREGRVQLRDLAPRPGGLNPRFCEWLMGWPIGWTALRPLAMVRFRKWSLRRGKL